MTQENKQLLLQDLCGRLLYDIIVRCYFVDGGGEEVLDTDDIAELLYNDEDNEFPMYKPYLRPMSSMTEEERNEISKKLNYEFYVDDEGALCAEDDRHRVRVDLIEIYIDWLNAHHFDYRGLIEMGLALEAPEEMYNAKTE